VNVTNITVVDLDHTSQCIGSIDEIWNVVCFHEVNDISAIVYTAGITNDNGSVCLYWTLYEFTNTTSVKELRSGWFDPPDIDKVWLRQTYSST
jgi:hypothetical protein